MPQCMDTYSIGELYTREQPFFCSIQYKVESEQLALKLCERLGQQWATIGGNGPLAPIVRSSEWCVVYEYRKLLVIVSWTPPEGPQEEGS